eukprot:scaffold201749_cov21-Tisochrysis_lutea.AAC.1
MTTRWVRSQQCVYQDQGDQSLLYFVKDPVNLLHPVFVYNTILLLIPHLAQVSMMVQCSTGALMLSREALVDVCCVPIAQMLALITRSFARLDLQGQDPDQIKQGMDDIVRDKRSHTQNLQSGEQLGTHSFDYIWNVAWYGLTGALYDASEYFSKEATTEFIATLNAQLAWEFKACICKAHFNECAFSRAEFHILLLS